MLRLKLIQTFRKKLLSVLYPETALCLGCGAISDAGCLCGSCRGELTVLAARRSLQDARPDFPNAVFVWKHEGLPRHLIHLLKYEANACVAEEIAPYMVVAAQRAEITPDAILTWVPMPESRKRSRCIDHGQVLAKAVGKLLQMDTAPLLTRSAHARHTQQGLNRSKRLRNPGQHFAALGPVHRPVLLVDDVLTTGSTARLCMEALEKAGATSVYVLTATVSLKGSGLRSS